MFWPHGDLQKIQANNETTKCLLFFFFFVCKYFGHDETTFYHILTT